MLRIRVRVAVRRGEVRAGATGSDAPVCAAHGVLYAFSTELGNHAPGEEF